MTMEKIREGRKIRENKGRTNSLATSYYTSHGDILLLNLQEERAAPENLSQVQKR